MLEALVTRLSGSSMLMLSTSSQDVSGFLYPMQIASKFYEHCFSLVLAGEVSEKSCSEAMFSNA